MLKCGSPGDRHFIRIHVYPWMWKRVNPAERIRTLGSMMVSTTKSDTHRRRPGPGIPGTLIFDTRLEYQVQSTVVYVGCRARVGVSLDIVDKVHAPGSSSILVAPVALGR